jgi:hypothetical protein
MVETRNRANGRCLMRSLNREAASAAHAGSENAARRAASSGGCGMSFDVTRTRGSPPTERSVARSQAVIFALT